MNVIANPLVMTVKQKDNKEHVEKVAWEQGNHQRRIDI